MVKYRSNEPVTVLDTSDPAIIAVAKSLLDEANIPFYAKGDGLQDVVEIQVSEDDAAQARSVLVALARHVEEH